MEFLKDNKFIKMEIKAIKMWKLIKYESHNQKHSPGLRNIQSVEKLKKNEIKCKKNEMKAQFLFEKRFEILCEAVTV